jgi:ActR/RegA family two-component response regulator
MLQEEHRNMLIRNDTLIQESLQREMRKRDFDAQNNHVSDLAQHDFLKKEKATLKE